MARILLVEDDPVILRLFVQILEAAGHEIRTAQSEADAVRLLSEAPPEILMMDLRIPTLEEGLRVLRAAAEHRGTMRIIVLSGQSAELEEHPESKYVDRVLLKPVPMRALVDVIAELSDH